MIRRIALVTDGIFPYVIGGMQKHSYYLVKYLSAMGIHIDLYHMNQSQYDIHKLDVFTRSEKEFIHAEVVTFPKLTGLPGHYLRESYQYSASICKRLLARPPVDFIYAKGFSGWNLIEEKKKGVGLPLIGVNFHGYEMFQVKFGWRTRLENQLLKSPVRYCTRNADVVFSYGGKITSIIEKLGVPRSNIIEVPAGISAGLIREQPGDSHRPLRFVFVGRNERRKGIRELHSILQKLKEKDAFTFDFVGPIPEGERVRSEKIRYHGTVSDQDRLFALLAEKDILVCPSHSEGMPNVILEAMANGLAVIATDVGAVSKLVDSSNGWLIPPGNIHALEDAMAKAMQAGPAVMNSMKRRSLEKTRAEFTWDLLVGNLVSEIYKRVP